MTHIQLRRLLAGALALASVAVLEPAIAQDPTARLVQAGGDDGNWLTHGRTYSEQRYAPLKKITPETVKGLGLAWSFDIDEPRPVESTPLVVDGLIYVTGGWSKVYAVNADTGAEIWRFDPEVPREWGARACCDVVNRGVAYWDGKVYVGTIDGRLIALDAKTGKVVWSAETVDRNFSYTITGAPRIVKGKVVIGNGGAEYGVRGYVSAYDGRTGKMAWRFYTVPGNPADGFENEAMRAAAKTWTGAWWKYGGGGTVWDSIVFDPDLNLLYLGVGNGAPHNRNIRSPGGGDNLYLSSVVAIDPDTGAYVWHFQETPGDSWDYTATQTMILADLTIDGAPRKVLMQAPKNAFFYVLDRTNGKLISTGVYAAMNWASGIDKATGRPIETPQARYTNGATVRIQPGQGGGHNWDPMSFSPQTGLAYFPVSNGSRIYRDDPAFDFNAAWWNLGILDTSINPDLASAVMLPVQSGQYLVAWDPVNQREAWRAPGPGGGTLVTSTGLVFQGHGRGTFAAFDARTGRELWKSDVQNRARAGAVAFTRKGEEYVAVAVGGGNEFLAKEPAIHPNLLPNSNRLLVYKLGGSGQLPAIEFPTRPPLKKPTVTVAAQTVAAGRVVYHRFCRSCHGREADRGPGSVGPDLRFSELLADAADWRGVVMDGAFAERGMAGFRNAFGDAEAEQIRGYVISEAQNGLQPPAARPAVQAPEEPH